MKQQGFSLIELVTVLLIITVLSTIAIRSTVDIGYNARYEQTKDRLNSIKQAIIGNPNRYLNGQPDIHGFVADMGRLPDNVRELIQRYNCSNPVGAGPNNCITPGTPAWFDTTNVSVSNNLKHGWNGPYLTVSDNPANPDAYTDGWGREAQGYCSDPTITDQTACTGANTWTVAANDFNYGWGYVIDNPNTGDLTIKSYGRDQTAGGSGDFEGDYPSSQPVINQSDWVVSISGGVTIGFIKPYTPVQRASQPTSLCTDPTNITESTCLTPESWYGGCSKAGYINKDSCIAAGGNWKSCSDGVSTNKTTCEAASGHWYGEGYGCSNQQANDKVSCLALSAIWRSCTDNGTITDQATCLLNNQIWYGDSNYTVDLPPQPGSYNSRNICMKVFFRKNDGTVGAAESSAVSIVENGGFQTITLNTFKDSTNTVVTDIPIGINSIGIYTHDGTNCTTNIYPADRAGPIPVLFAPHRQLAVIQW
ncbi:type II secretion system protein [methane-oxidizing endosymbiont of Gigantopelta aegis]|uniref:type II secretion system protein n=1 Tax=methane-oxidizing endosymbiont of Gigantopelta aegis TaxID=2794938 RepID=UPI0018DD400F|nr:type II secretion system protein [methane-oxidizing endosymbiont of Gigantopelta aegis]